MSSRTRRARMPRLLSSLVVACSFAMVVPPASFATPSWITQVPPEKLLHFQPRSPEDFARFAQENGLDASSRRARTDAATEPASALTGVGLWREWGPPVRADHTMLVDTRRHRLIVLGGLPAFDPQATVWARSLPDGDWAQIAELPWGRAVASVYDSLGDQLIVLHADANPQVDAFQFATQQWVHLWTGPANLDVSHAGMALDTRRGLLALLDTRDSGTAASLVVRVPLANPASWSAQIVSALPSHSYGRTLAIYDASHDLFGGILLSATFGPTGTSTLWTIGAAAPSDWTALASAAVASGSWRQLQVDDATGRILMTADSGASIAVSPTDGSAVWVTAGLSDARYFPAVAFEPASRQLYYEGGSTTPDLNLAATHSRLEFTAEVDSVAPWASGAGPGAGVGSWHATAPLCVASRLLPEITLDPVSQRAIVFGGYPGGFSDPGDGDFAAAHALDGTGDWLRLGDGSAAMPDRRYLHVQELDPDHHALLLFGGQRATGGGPVLGDLWSLSLEPNGVWQPLATSGVAPAPRRMAAFFFDAPRHRFVLTGGDDQVNVFHDAWELKLEPSPTWRPLAVSGPAPSYSVILPDPIGGDAWCIFNGLTPVRHVVVSDDTLRFEDVATAGAAPDLAHPPTIAGIDVARHRLVWLGGRNGSSDNIDTGVFWTTSLGSTITWQQGASANVPPTRRNYMGVAYEPNASQILMTCGYGDNQQYFGDTWALDLADLPTATQVSLAQSSSDARGVSLRWIVAGAAASAEVERSDDGQAWSFAGDAVRDGQESWTFTSAPMAAGARAAFRLVVRDGASSMTSAAAWLDGPVSARAALSLAPVANPARGAVSMRFTLPTAAPATLRLLDVSGRVVGEERIPAGASAWTFASRPAAGLYFAEIAQGGERRTARVVLLGGR